MAGSAPAGEICHLVLLAVTRTLTAPARIAISLRPPLGRSYPQSHGPQLELDAAIAQERRGIADLIDSLDESQLATESLCTGWDVKTVGSHLVSALADGTVRATLLGVRRPGSIDKALDEDGAPPRALASRRDRGKSPEPC